MQISHLALCLVLPAVASSSGSTFMPGTTCSDDGPSNMALLGKHLHIMELAWAPFAVKDATAAHGWTGFNIDVRASLRHQIFPHA